MITMEERKAMEDELLRLMDATPAMIFDPIVFAVTGERLFDPIGAEKLLKSRGKYPRQTGTDPQTGEALYESICDLVRRVYGDRAASLAEQLI